MSIVYPVTRTPRFEDFVEGRSMVSVSCDSQPCPRRDEHGRWLEVVIGDSENGVYDAKDYPK